MSIQPNNSPSLERTIVNIQSEFNDSIANLHSQMELINQLYRQSAEELSCFLEDQLNITGENQTSKTYQVVSGLERESIEMQPHQEGEKIDKAALMKKIAKAGSIAPRNCKAQPAGCSVLLSLLIDDIHSSFENLMLDPHARQHLSRQLNIKTLQGKPLTTTVRDMVRDHLNIVYQNIGGMTMFAQQGGNWHFPIGLEQAINSTANIQKQLIDQERLSGPHVILMDIQKFPTGKAYLDACETLVQVMLCEPNRLINPLSANPSLANHEKRLITRLANMASMISQFTASINLAKEARLDSVEKKKLAEALSMMQRFTDEALDVMKASQNNQSDPRKIYRFIVSWIGSVEDQEGEFRFYQELSQNIQNIEMDPLKRNLKMDNYLIVMRKLHVLYWMHKSVMDEIALCNLTEQIQKDKSMRNEAESAIVKLTEVVRTMQEASLLEIESYLNQEGTNKTLAMNLRDIWVEDFGLMRNSLLTPLLRSLELRLERIKQTDATVLETALAYRDVLIVFGTNVPKFINGIKRDLERQQKLIQNLPDEDPHRKAFLAMNNLLLLNEAALKAVTDRVEAFIYNRIDETDKKEAVPVKKSSPKGKGQKEIDKEVEELLKGFGAEGGAKTGKKKGIAKPSQPKRKATPTSPAKPEKIEKLTETKEVKETAPVFDSAPKVRNVSALSTSLPSLKGNLLLLGERLPINGIDLKFRSEWRKGQVENALTLIRQIEELGTLPAETSAFIGFDQIDLSRKLSEAVLEIILATFPVVSQQLSILRDAGTTNHRLHIWIRELLKAEDSIPAAVRQTAWQLREVPYLLSDANACVNYPHNTFAEKERMHPRSRKLLDFLMNIEQAERTDAANLQQQSVYFADRLLMAALHPEQVKLANLSKITELLPRELPVSTVKVLNSAPLEAVEEQDELTPPLKKVEIHHRKEAHSAVKSAIDWINIRLLAPVQGSTDSLERTEKRDQALKNAATHLKRLKEHLDKFRFNRPNLTLLCQMELCRRAHKELHIAALYQTEEGSVIADQERFCNNPLILSRALKDVLSKEAALPRLGSWLSAAHQVASYPVALTSAKKQGFEVKELRKLVAKVREMAYNQHPEAYGFTLVGGSKRGNRDEKIRDILKNHERARTFPALEQLLELLRKGF